MRGLKQSVLHRTVMLCSLFQQRCSRLQTRGPAGRMKNVFQPGTRFSAVTIVLRCVPTTPASGSDSARFSGPPFPCLCFLGSRSTPYRAASGQAKEESARFLGRVLASTLHYAIQVPMLPIPRARFGITTATHTVPNYPYQPVRCLCIALFQPDLHSRWTARSDSVLDHGDLRRRTRTMK